ncbi:hypothetical protein ACH4JS_10375 [Streptomyces sp. NPDC017638]|uniref:hypothetical protein n=1 Tax=Streptomyces sp. NPDC017638 TaxID=3365004 RepID=UPI0037B3EE16
MHVTDVRAGATGWDASAPWGARTGHALVVAVVLALAVVLRLPRTQEHEVRSGEVPFPAPVPGRKPATVTLPRHGTQ